MPPIPAGEFVGDDHQGAGGGGDGGGGGADDGAGDEAPNEGTDVTWRAPLQGKKAATITVTADDKAELPDGDIGDRDDASVKDKVTVDVVSCQIAGHDQPTPAELDKVYTLTASNCLPIGGTYEWTIEGGEIVQGTNGSDTVQVRFTTAGLDKTVNLTYTWDGFECSAQRWDASTKTMVSDAAKFYVPTIDVDLDGLPDDKEETPGGAIRPNTDDDDRDNTKDKDDTDGVTGENDLKKLTLSGQYPDDETATLEYSGPLKVWENSDLTGAVDSGKTYAPGDLPKELWLEGTEAGTGEVTFTFSKGGVTVEDTVKVAVIQADVIIDGVGEDKEDQNTECAEVFTNDDYDEGNTDGGDPARPRQDFQEDAVHRHRIDPDDELRDVQFRVDGRPSTGKWARTFPSCVKVWRQDNETWVEIESGKQYPEGDTEFESAPFSKRLKLEGMPLGRSPRIIQITGKFTPAEASHAFEDRAKVIALQLATELVAWLEPGEDTGEGASSSSSFKAADAPAADCNCHRRDLRRIRPWEYLMVVGKIGPG